MNMGMEFLDIAKIDLEASKVLYEKELYPQAVFYLQQSVEKATKAFILITGKKVTEKEFVRDIGHEAINIFEIYIRNQKNEYEQLKANLNKLPELKETKIFKNFNLEKNIRQLDKHLSAIKKVKKDKMDLIYISSWDIRSILKEIKSANEELEKSKKKISNFKITDRVWNKMKTEMLELYDSLSKYNPLQIEEAKNNLQSNDMKLLVERYIKSLIEPMSIIPLSISLYYLAIVTLPHAIIARYPKNGLTPVNIYTKKLPVVRMLPELINVQLYVLKELKILNNKFEEINAGAI